VINLSSAPTSVVRLAQLLDDAGCPLHSTSYGSVRNQLLEVNVAAKGFRVRVAADRSQWFVELAPGHSEDYFDTAVWRACLAGTDVSLDLEPLESQVEWIIEKLADRGELTANLGCLRAARHERACRRLGLTP
jgi:hypothetical protein